MKKNQANANVGKYIIHGSYEAESRIQNTRFDQKKLSKWIEHLDSGHVPATIWSNYSDLTRPHPKCWFGKGNPLISGKSERLVKYYYYYEPFGQNYRQ